MVHKKFGKLLVDIMETPSVPWTLEKCAKHVNMSRANFSRKFKDVSGNSPMQILVAVRMQIAAQILARENTTVAIVAEMVGYSNVSSFHKAFFRYYDLTPNHYKKIMQEI